MKEKPLKENVPYCVKCDEEMQEVLLPRYEYVEETVLHNVNAFRCNSCEKLFFTQQQAKAMKARTQELQEYTFGFERKVLVSGKSLVVGIPQELAEHLDIHQGQTVKIYPLANEGLIVKKL